MPVFLYGHDIVDNGAVKAVIADSLLPPAPGVRFPGLAVVRPHPDCPAGRTFILYAELLIILNYLIDVDAVPVRPGISPFSDLVLDAHGTEYPAKTRQESAFGIHPVNLVQRVLAQPVGHIGK